MAFLNKFHLVNFGHYKKLFDREKYEDPRYYDDYYDELSEEEKKSWNRFSYILIRSGIGNGVTSVVWGKNTKRFEKKRK